MKKNWMRPFAGTLLSAALALTPLSSVLAADISPTAAPITGPDPAAVPSAAVQSAGTYALTTAPGAADTAALQDATVDNLAVFGTDRVMQGVSNREDTYFEIGQGRRVLPGSYLELSFGHSPTLLPKRSTLTVMLDDLPLGSVFLDEGNREGAQWRLDLSGYPFTPGFHKLSVLTHMEVSNNLCEDQNNEANWIRFSRNSVIHLNLTHSYGQADLSFYPSPFLEQGGQQPLKAAFVLPDAPQENELTVLAMITQAWAATVSGSRLSYQVVRESELTEGQLKSLNLVWIGQPGGWKDKGSLAEETARSLEPSAERGDYLALTPSPWNPEAAQLMLQAEGEALTRAAEILTRPELYGQLFGHIVDVPAKLNAAPSETGVESGGKRQQVTLQDMGYGNLVVEGKLVGAARISYAVPGSWELSEGAKLRLMFTHSKTLNLAQSLISVKVNDTPVASRHLTEETSDAGVLELTLPPELIGEARILNIDAGFQFGAAEGEACSGSVSELGNWAVISRESFLSFEYNNREVTDLQSLPAPLIGREGWNDSVIVVPEEPTSEELSTLATVIGTLGRSAGNRTGLSLVSAGNPELASLLADKHVLYVGAAQHMPALLAGAEDPVRYENGRLVAAAADVELLSPVQQRCAWLLVGRSPVSGDYSKIIVSAADPAWLKLVPAVLSSPENSGKLQGKLSVIDERQEVHVFQNTAAAAPSKSRVGEAVGDLLTFSGDTVLQRMIYILVLIAVLAAVGLLLWVSRKRKKTRKPNR